MFRPLPCLRSGLAFVLGMYFLACGGGGANNTPTPTATASPTPTPTPTPTASPIPASAPCAFWVSQPVNQDETMLITAGNLVPGSTTVELAQLGDEDPGDPASQTPSFSNWTALTALTSTSRSLTATVPADWSNGVYALRLRNSADTDKVRLINAPDPWFVQGDMGDTATPGGSFTVAGIALERMGGLTPQAALVNKGTGLLVTKLALVERITTSTGYALRFAVPANVAEGEYQLWLHNGRGGKAAWARFSTFIEAPIDSVVVKKAKIWPSAVFNLGSYSGSDDDKFAAAIAAASANGGGQIYVPAGTYTLTKQLVLPAYTILAGAGRDNSLIKWANGITKTLVLGKEIQASPYKRASFAIEDVTLQAGTDFRNRVIERSYTTEYSWIKRAVIKAPQFVSEALWDNAPTAIYVEETRNLVLDDLVMDAHNCVVGRVGVSYLRLQNSNLTWFGRHLGVSGRSHNLVLTNNTLTQRAGTGDPTGLNLTTFHGDPDFGGPYSRDFLLARNSSTREPTSIPIKRSQGYTSDGSNGIYVGKIAAVSGTSLTLAGKTADPLRPVGVPVTYSWAGAIAQIVEGRGAGQWRYISAATAGVSSVTIDRAWDIEPDATSTLTIVNLQGRQLMVDNDFGAEPQFDDFYMPLDSIRAGNKFGTTGSDSTVTAWAGNVYAQPATFAAWHYQVLDNQTVRGTNMGYISMSLDLDDNVHHFPYHGVSGASHVYRNNQNATAGSLDLSVQSSWHPFADLVIERNQFDKITFENHGTSAPISLSGVLMRQNKKAAGTASPVLPSANLAGIKLAD